VNNISIYGSKLDLNIMRKIDKSHVIQLN